MGFEYHVVGSGLHDAESLGRITADYESALASLGGRPAGSDLAGPVLVATGGTERRILDLWEADPSAPLMLLAHPGHNSLPSALEALARVHQSGGRGRIVFLSGPNDSQLEHAVIDLEVRNRMSEMRIGLLGNPSDWLVASAPGAEVVQRVWGPEVVPIDLGPLMDAFAPVDPDRRDATISIGELGKAEAVTAAMREVVARERLDAVSVRCFDLIGGIDTTGCIALSDLNDSGVVAGCEGDLVSTIGMIWARLLLDVVPWMANPARVDVDAGLVLLAHCTVPAALTTRVRLDTHFESGRGVGLAGEIPAGPATLLRIGGTGMDRLWLAEGEIVGSPSLPDLCRTQVEVQIPDGAVADLLARPLGNHLVLVPGHHAGRLRSWWELVVGTAGGSALWS